MPVEEMGLSGLWFTNLTDLVPAEDTTGRCPVPWGPEDTSVVDSFGLGLYALSDAQRPHTPAQSLASVVLQGQSTSGHFIYDGSID